MTPHTINRLAALPASKQDRSAAERDSSRLAMTLVEVLAVVAILGIIATTLTLSFRGQVGRAKRELAKTGIGVVVGAVETYAIETGRLPSMEEGLTVLTRVPQGRGEPYLRADKLVDPWGRPYAYVAPGPESAYQVICYGADGALGGDGEAADTTSDDLGGAASTAQGGAG